MKNTIRGNPSLIRDINRTGVMDHIRRFGPVSQSELAKMMRLQPSTILRVTKELEDEGLITQTGKSSSTSKGGRRATLLELQPKGAVAVGIDLGADEILASLVDLTGHQIGSVRTESPSQSSPEQVLEAVIDTVRRLLAEHPAYGKQIMGIGVALPGRLDTHSGVSLYASNFKDWRDVDVVSPLKEAFDLPVQIGHDVSLMSLGELWFGAGTENMFCLGFRHGIGLGIVVGGKIYRGSRQFAGDIGHVMVQEDGPLCSCGQRGCLEAVAGEGALLEFYRRKKSEAGGIREAVTMNDVYAALQSGDAAMTAFAQAAAGYVARSLIGLVRVFDPDKIVLGGEIFTAFPAFFEMIQSDYLRQKPTYDEEVPGLELAKHGVDSISIGAAVLFLSTLFVPQGDT